MEKLLKKVWTNFLIKEIKNEKFWHKKYLEKGFKRCPNCLQELKQYGKATNK